MEKELFSLRAVHDSVVRDRDALRCSVAEYERASNEHCARFQEVAGRLVKAEKDVSALREELRVKDESEARARGEMQEAASVQRGLRAEVHRLEGELEVMKQHHVEAERAAATLSQSAARWREEEMVYRGQVEALRLALQRKEQLTFQLQARLDELGDCEAQRVKQLREALTDLDGGGLSGEARQLAAYRQRLQELVRETPSGESPPK